MESAANSPEEPGYLDEFSGHGTGGYSRAAAEGLKLHVFDDTVLDLKVHFHYVAAFGVSDFSHRVSVFDNAYVSRMKEMIHYFIAV